MDGGKINDSIEMLSLTKSQVFLGSFIGHAYSLKVRKDHMRILTSKESVGFYLIIFSL